MLFDMKCSPFVDETTTDLRKSIKFTKNQTLILEAGFKLDNYPNNSHIKKLAEQTQLSEAQVYSWYKRKREKLKQEDREFRTPTCVRTLYACMYTRTSII